MKPDYHKIKVQGISTAYTIRRSNDPTIVCIHGNSLSRKNFMPILEASYLNSSSLMTYDLPGHGDSERAADPRQTCTLRGYSAHLKGLMNALGLKEIVLVGFSLGGHIAMEAASEGLPGLKALILIASPPVGTLEDFPLAFPSQADGISLFKEAITREESQIMAGKLTSDTGFHETLSAAILSADPAARSALMHSLEAREFSNEREHIAGAPVPVILFFGDRDRIISLEYIKSLNIDKNLNIQIKVTSGGEHFADWNAPGGIISTIGSLIKQLNE